VHYEKPTGAKPKLTKAEAIKPTIKPQSQKQTAMPLGALSTKNVVAKPKANATVKKSSTKKKSLKKRQTLKKSLKKNTRSKK
jgi:hypothetical protein